MVFSRTKAKYFIGAITRHEMARRRRRRADRAATVSKDFLDEILLQVGTAALHSVLSGTIYIRQRGG